MTTTKKKIKIKELEQDYLENTDSIFNDDTERVLRLKKGIKALPLPERRVILLYAELGTAAEVSRQLNCSVESVKQIIRAVRERLGLVQYKKKNDLCK